MIDYWSEVVWADTECVLPIGILDNDLELARKDVTLHWPSNDHKSGIIDIVRIDKVEFSVEKD